MSNSNKMPIPPEYEKGMYTVEEVSRFLSIPRSTVYDLIRDKRPGKGLQAVKIGGRYRFPRKPIDDLMRGEQSE